MSWPSVEPQAGARDGEREPVHIDHIVGKFRIFLAGLYPALLAGADANDGLLWPGACAILGISIAFRD
jgi:hypothetical protein